MDTYSVPNSPLVAKNLKITQTDDPTKYKISWELVEEEYYYNRIAKKKTFITLPDPLSTPEQKETLKVKFASNLDPWLLVPLPYKIIMVTYRTVPTYEFSQNTINIKVKIYDNKDIVKSRNIIREEEEKRAELKRQREEGERLIEEMENKKKIPNPILQEDCPICLESMADKESVETNCKHHFHKECLDEHLRTKNSCPLCRQRVTGTNVIPKLIKKDEKSGIGGRKTRKYKGRRRMKKLTKSNRRK